MSTLGETNMAGGAAGAAAAAQALVRATRAMGVVVRVEPQAFLIILGRQSSPLVVTGRRFVIFSGHTHQYLTNYRGIFFYTESKSELPLPDDTEMIAAKSIWIPGQ